MSTPRKPRASAPKSDAPKAPRATAIRVELDLTNALSSEELPSAPSRSPLRGILEQLRDATRRGDAPHETDEWGEVGALKFVLVGQYRRPSGARSAQQGLAENPNRVPGALSDWEFAAIRVTVDGQPGSELRARYIGQ